ncbi:MAG: penicillin acylase family protein [Bacteroidia bacterium]|nr:penicillin acylase family protein [Bacteroidia bacterium]
MKILRYSLFAVITLLLLCCAGGYFYVSSTAPEYDGAIALDEVSDSVEILYDKFGVPHIYGKTEKDVYFALGYAHARDRLFQMELIRRLAEGRLAETFGPDLIKADLLFRTLGIHRHSENAVKTLFQDTSQPWQQAAAAYLNGLNYFVETGETPLEFTILGIEKQPFTLEFLYDVSGYMAFGFAEGLKEEPVTDKILRQYGETYLQDLDLHLKGNQAKIPWGFSDSTQQTPTLAATVTEIIQQLPVSLFIGSNAWVISPKKSASGKVIFANDPHIGFAQPAVWYEAHIETPNFTLYGNHLAGFPFAPIGHTRSHAIGLTMFENDDTHFYREKLNPEDPSQVWVNDHWENLVIREEIIHVKGKADTTLKVQISRHGPIVNHLYAPLTEGDSAPVALWWSYLQTEPRVLEAAYGLAHAGSMTEIKESVAKIHAPGLNVMYGDTAGNIAWWTTGHLVKYAEHVDTKRVLDGASGRDEPLEVLPFSDHPQVENPPTGYVYSANNQPEATKGFLVPGYYVPEIRARRIMNLLENKDVWSAEEVRTMAKDDIGSYPEMLKSILPLINREKYNSETAIKSLEMMENWDGSHDLEAVGPTLFYKLSNRMIYLAMADELGEKDYLSFATTHLMKRSLPFLLANDSSAWWNNIQTADIKETRTDICNQAFSEALAELEEMLGKDVNEWQWKRIHTVEHEHPMGKVAPLNKLFNVGPFPIAGGQEVINNTGFSNAPSGIFKVKMGPSRRAVIDFADLEHGQTILPTGQSGNPMSPHYKDQAEMYVRGEYRTMLLNRKEIQAEQKHQLIFTPHLR